MSSQKSDRIVKCRAPKVRSRVVESVDRFEGSYEDFTALVEGPRAQWVTARALHLAVQHINALPPQEQATSDRHDMQLILHYGYPTFAELFRILDSQSEESFRHSV
jgi:hypothetical protein